MRQINPVTLHVHQTDETTIKAVQLYTRQIVLHTCNASEYWAALASFKPCMHQLYTGSV